MGLLSKMFGGTPRTITPKQLIESTVLDAFTVALKPPNCLFDRLRALEMPVSNEFYSECETVLFALLPLDIVVAGQFGMRGWGIREGIRTQFVELLKMRVGPANAQRLPADQLHQHASERFEEYVAALQSDRGPDGVRVMSMLAYRNITGTDGKSNLDAYLAGGAFLGEFFSTVYPNIISTLKQIEVAW